MTRHIAASIVVVAVAVLAVGHWVQQAREVAPADHMAMISQYCTDCHSNAERAGDLALDRLRPDSIHADARVWESVINKLRGGLMPPPDARQPEVARVDAFLDWIETSIDRHAARNPNPGTRSLHRLNRAEYGNAMRDLLHLPVDVNALLPGDDSSGGFDNIANALSVSPVLMEAYVTAATRISRLAVGDMSINAGITNYRAPRGFNQADNIEGMPLGTRGGMSVEHVFPLDAEYEIRVARAGGGFGLQTVNADDDVEITINGERVALLSGGARRSVTVAVSAGPQTIGAALVRRSVGTGVDDLYSVFAASPGIQGISIVGPHNPAGPGDTPSRQRIFVCRPAEPEQELPCAEEILTTLATRAFRRPVHADDQSMSTLMEFYESGREQLDFDRGIQSALARILVDPQFIFRFEEEPEELAPGEVYELGGLELASRLSFFLWSSIPDDELLAVAASGALRDPGELERQARRMLADPKSDALVENFAGQWFELRHLDSLLPLTREFDGNLRHAFEQETKLLFASVLREDRSIIDLLDADYTFVDERLARHYGLPNIRGSHVRRVSLAGADETRRGLLGHGSFLTLTSAPNRTSPVKRGAWILENILGTPIPSPPDDVEALLDESPEEVGSSTLRERLVRHMESPDCASCHRIMDPLGFALENFDLIGKWRDLDGGFPVDASGELVDGTLIHGPGDLRRALLDRSDLFAMTATRKLMTYALGRVVDYKDMPAVRSIARQAVLNDYRFSSFVTGIVTSVPFRMKVKVADGDESEPEPVTASLQ